MHLIILAVLVALPVLAAVVMVALGAPAPLGPILVVLAGLGWAALAGRTVIRAARHYAAESGAPVSEGLDTVEGEQILRERPQTAFVPFLVTASWINVLIGLIWLAFVDLWICIGAAAVLIGLYYAYHFWRRRHPLDKSPAQ